MLMGGQREGRPLKGEGAGAKPEAWRNRAPDSRGGYGSLGLRGTFRREPTRGGGGLGSEEEEGEADSGDPAGLGSGSGVLMLLRCASAGDRALMALGCTMAVLHGVAFPVLALVFGNMTNVFLNITTANPQLDGSVASALAPLVGFGLALEGSFLNESRTSTSGAPPLAPPPADYLPALTNFMSHFSFYYLALGAIVLVAASVQVFCWERTAERLVHRLRLLFFAQVVRQDVAWFERRAAGDAATKITE